MPLTKFPTLVDATPTDISVAVLLDDATFNYQYDNIGNPLTSVTTAIATLLGQSFSTIYTALQYVRSRVRPNN